MPAHSFYFSVSCWGFPLARPSPEHRARKPEGAAGESQLPGACNRSGQQVETNQPPHSTLYIGRWVLYSHFTAGQTEAWRPWEMQ